LWQFFFTIAHLGRGRGGEGAGGREQGAGGKGEEFVPLVSLVSF